MAVPLPNRTSFSLGIVAMIAMLKVVFEFSKNQIFYNIHMYVITDKFRVYFIDDYAYDDDNVLYGVSSLSL